MKLQMVPIQGKEKIEFHFEQINPYIAPPQQFQQQFYQPAYYTYTNGNWGYGGTTTDTDQF